MAGRPRKPTAVLKLEQGKVYASRYGDRSGEPSGQGVPLQPELTGRALEHWQAVVPRLVQR